MFFPSISVFLNPSPPPFALSLILNFSVCPGLNSIISFLNLKSSLNVAVPLFLEFYSYSWCYISTSGSNNG